jgi:hypothetical protein
MAFFVSLSGPHGWNKKPKQNNKKKNDCLTASAASFGITKNKIRTPALFLEPRQKEFLK